MITRNIRESVLLYLPTAEFSYGRKFDTAVEASKIKVTDYFVALDTVSFTEDLTTGNSTASVSIAFLKLDKGDSSFDAATNVDIAAAIETIQNDCYTTSKLWVKYFQNTWGKMPNNKRYQYGQISFNGLTRVKDMMSGMLLSFTLTYKEDC